MVKDFREQELSGYQSSAVQFSSIIVANLMLINSGALFTFPAFLQKSTSITPAVVEAASAPYSCFVVGVVLATVCGYVAYINYGLLKFSLYNDHFADEINLKYPIATERSPEIEEWCQNTLSDLKLRSKKFRFRVWITFWLGQLLGLGSLTAFSYGCYLVKLAVLI